MQDNKIEIQKIKHLLQSTDVEFNFLDKLSQEELKKLRLKINSVIDIDQAEVWNRIAKVATFMPNFLNAKVAETVLGPMISANLANYVPIKDAVAILKNISTPFLAQTASFMIPEKSIKLIDAIPIDILKKVTKELVAQKKYFIASNFVNVLPIQRIITLSEIIYDELDLILISEFVDNKQHIAKIVGGFSDDKILNIIKTAYTNNKQDEILNVFVLLEKSELNRVLKIVNTLTENVKNQILEDFKIKINA